MDLERLDDPDYPVASMGQAAELLGVQPAFLRSLDAAGLLHPHRSDGGHRRYSRRQLDFAAAVRTLSDQGHTIAGAAAVIELQEHLATAHRDLQATQHDLQATQHDLETAQTERDTAQEQRDTARQERDTALAERDQARGDLTRGDLTRAAEPDARPSAATVAGPAPTTPTNPPARDSAPAAPHLSTCRLSTPSPEAAGQSTRPVQPTALGEVVTRGRTPCGDERPPTTREGPRCSS